MEVPVRAARDLDGDELTRIDLATWTPISSPSEPPAGYHFFGERTQPSDVLVAEVDGRVAGYVKLVAASSMPSHAHVQLINGLAVDPPLQGRGVGRVLLAAAVALAHRRGAGKVSLRVLGTNPRARRLYERCGFVVEGVLRGEFERDGRLVDDILMSRRLGPDD